MIEEKNTENKMEFVPAELKFIRLSDEELEGVSGGSLVIDEGKLFIAGE